MLSRTKKILILSGMLLLLVVTGYLNVLLNSQATDVDKNNTQNLSFFESFKIQRESDYNDDMLVYDSIINNDKSTPTQKGVAEESKMKLAQSLTKAKALEQMLVGKGFSDCFIYTSIDTNKITVFAKKEELNTESVAIILDTIITQTAATPVDVEVNPV